MRKLEAYQNLLLQSLLFQQAGDIASEDVILAKMDDVWIEMNLDDREKARKFANEISNSEAILSSTPTVNLISSQVVILNKKDVPHGSYPRFPRASFQLLTDWHQSLAENWIIPSASVAQNWQSQAA